MLFVAFYTSISFLLIQTLTILNLEHNDIGASGVQYLADALQNNKVTFILSMAN
jgi:hypothetical protein